MEIDLELPSGEENKLDPRLNTHIDGALGLSSGHEETLDPKSQSDIGDFSNGIHIGEEVSSPSSRNVQENSVPSVGENINSSVKEVKTCDPQRGLEFESKEAAYSFYREYARSVGFGITIKSSRRSKKSGKFIDVKIACSRFGSKREFSTTIHPRPCLKTDCKASMHMKRRDDGKWFICSFVKEHNHEICPEDFYYALKGRSRKSGVVACQRKGLQLSLDESDVQLLFEFFMFMQEENPNFFYAVDLDNEKRMRNLLFVDAKGRQDYTHFCDAVFFDSSHVSNRYRIPLVTIYGVNHHFQLILLGCALIGDENKSTFVWLMRAWLRAVGGQSPKVILTDESKSIGEATTEVFPDTRHCFCLWHLQRKILENLGDIVQSDKFMRKFNKCIHQSWTSEELEKKWWKMMDKFELREDKWFQSLYRNREKWVPLFMNDTFLGGMCSPERSESISSFFNKYIDREIMLKGFIDQYRVFLCDRYEEEARADLVTRQSHPSLKSLSPFEKQMSRVYTKAIFEKFQAEVLGIVACSVQKQCENETYFTLQVDSSEEGQSFIVEWNEAESQICCSCRSFEYMGILCRHAMFVLQMCGVSSIPSHYILRRWTKDAKSRPLTSEIPNKHHYKVQRFNDLCKRVIRLGEEGSLSLETYNIVICALQKAKEDCVGLYTSVTQGLLDIEEENQGHNTGKASREKKMQKKRKLQHETRVLISGLQDNNRQMGLFTSVLHSSDDTCIPQLIPERGQLNSTPVRVGLYSPQQSLQGLLQGQLGFRPETMHGCFNIQDSLDQMEQSSGYRQMHNIESKRTR